MSWRKIPFCLCVLYEFEGLKVIAFTELIVSVSIAVIHYNPCLAIDALASGERNCYVYALPTAEYRRLATLRR